ncbi:MAG: hypothetical protein UT88_C0001G0009 [Candidatus Woesebacteria bacterium GW2011_GWD2_40_19]|nr:MAG: hypothetical protein UT88_C0001G0009 [Candidatus Woesebacteria bacterium GW2011_GWD2_40_19]HAU65562.1 hypothetical protein [Candidatus Woesebacteria bacterium]HCC08505.1 hypothetical protein [Candidatus Woesebacteria bacterium]
MLNEDMVDKDDKTVNKKMLDEAVQTILTGMDDLYSRFDGVDKRFDGVDKRFDGVDKRLDKIESNIYFVKQDVRDIKADLSDTPTRNEFDKLKAKVNAIAS